MQASNDNLDEGKTDPRRVYGVESSWALHRKHARRQPRRAGGRIQGKPTLVATHCEDEATIRRNSAAARERYGEFCPSTAPAHPCAEACYRSSSMAVELAEKSNTRLHILHISTAKEVGLFRNDILH